MVSDSGTEEANITTYRGPDSKVTLDDFLIIDSINYLCSYHNEPAYKQLKHYNKFLDT